MSDRIVLHTSDHIDISHDVRHGWLYVDWKGPQTTEQVKAGCERMLEALRAAGVSKVLNDNTNVVGSWSGAADWVAVDWLPRMRAAGLKYFAWVQSPSLGSRAAANQSAFVAGKEPLVLLFNDRASAGVWLRTVDGPRR